MARKSSKESAETRIPRSSRIEALSGTRRRAMDDDAPASDSVDARLEVLELVLHDIQSPVAVLDVSMRLLATDLADAHGDVQDTLRDARRAVQRIRQYIDHLVASERLNAGGFAPMTSNVDLRRRLKDLTDEFSAYARLIGAELDLVIPETGSFALDADETMLARLFQNLLENALRHAGAGGHVRIEVRREGVLEVRVCNDGPRIPAEQREQVFRKFSPNARANRAFGVGLYFSRLAAEAHRGTLVLEDDPEWPVCFVVRLPVASL